jgi:hypothetical protein
MDQTITNQSSEYQRGYRAGKSRRLEDLTDEEERLVVKRYNDRMCAQLVAKRDAIQKNIDTLNTLAVLVDKGFEFPPGTTLDSLLDPDGDTCTTCGSPIVIEDKRGWWCTNRECELSKKLRDTRKNDKYRPEECTSDTQNQEDKG